MNEVYPLARTEFLRGNLDWETHAFRIYALNNYTYAGNDETLADIPDEHIVADTAIDGFVGLDGQAVAPNITFVAVPAGSTITGLLIARDTGDAATSTLIAHIIHTSTDVPINIDTADVDITIEWGQYVFRI